MFHVSVRPSAEKLPGQRLFFSPAFATALTLCFATVCAASIHSHLSTLFLGVTVRTVAMWLNICCHGFCDKDQTYPNFTHFILVLSWSSSVLLSVDSQAALRWAISGNGRMVPCQVHTKNLGGVIAWA